MVRLLLAYLAVTLVAAGQSGPLERPASGRLLVAEEQVDDPRFARSVVLLIDYGPEGAMGLIINRPARLTLAEALPSLESLAGRDDRIYFGGPVQPEALLLLLRSDEQPSGFEPVLDDVHLGASATRLAQLISSGVGANRVRGYAGYAGWGPGQLDNEIARGDWSILPAASSQVFDPAPDALWKELMERRRIRFARLVSRGW